MNISTQFLTNYLIERDLNWEAFEAFSPMAAAKKEQLIANWRFGDTISAEDVKKVLRPFKLSYDDFISAYLNRK